MELKIFEINTGGEREWVAAYSNIHALQVVYSFNDVDLMDYNSHDEVKELPREKWDEYTVKDEDDEATMTFAEWMQANKEPDMIATTAY
jgi:hypothetical protein